MNELLARYNQLDSHLKMVVFGGFLFLIVALDGLLLLRPQLMQFIKLGKNIEEVQTNIQKTLKNVERAHLVRMEMTASKKAIILLQKRVPGKDSVTMILERISLLASQNNIDIETISPNMKDQKVLMEKLMIFLY